MTTPTIEPSPQDSLCEDCPRTGYITDRTRCNECPRMAILKTTLSAFDNELRFLFRRYEDLRSALKAFYVGRRVCARPLNNGAKLLPYRDGIINSVHASGLHLSFGIDWFKKDGSGEFHDYGPAWYRTFIPSRNISHISSDRHETYVERYRRQKLSAEQSQ